MNFIKFNNQLINLEHVSRIHTEEIIDSYPELQIDKDPKVLEYLILISFTHNSHKNRLRFSFRTEEQRNACFGILESLTLED